MKLPRYSRVVAALLAMVSMLFSQLAIAAYACPNNEVVQSAQALVAEAVTHDHHATMDCEQVMDQTALCHAHCQAEKQSIDKPQIPNLTPSVAILLIPAISDSTVPYRPVIAVAGTWLMRDSAPPLSIRHCCFRI